MLKLLSTLGCPSDVVDLADQSIVRMYHSSPRTVVIRCCSPDGQDRDGRRAGTGTRDAASLCPCDRPPSGRRLSISNWEWRPSVLRTAARLRREKQSAGRAHRSPAREAFQVSGAVRSTVIASNTKYQVHSLCRQSVGDQRPVAQRGVQLLL